MTESFSIKQERLLTGANALRSRTTAPGSVAYGHPSITFGEDATYGTYIKTLQMGAVRFDFDPCYLFQFIVYHVANATSHLLPTAALAPTVSTAEATGVVTISLATGITGMSVAVTLTPLAEGYRANIVMTNTSAVYAVEMVEFPRLACKAPSGVAANGWLAHGFCGGLVITNPYEKDLTVFGQALEAPPSMQFFDYYDISTKDHLYVATDDDNGWRKQHQLTGDGSSVALQGFRHYFPNSKTAGNGGIMPFTVPYHVDIELFKGRTADGRMGCYDSAIRYRTWATAAARPWMTDGPWAASANISSRVKSADLYYVRLLNEGLPAGTPHTTIVEDMRRLKSFVESFAGATHMLALLYGWSDNMDFDADFQPPAFSPLNNAADLNTALGTAAANNIHMSAYTIPQWWDSALTGAPNAPFRFEDFIGTIDYNSIAQYVIRSKDDVPLTITNFGLADDIFGPLPEGDE